MTMKMSKSMARRLRVLINKVVNMEIACAMSALDQVGDPWPARKRRVAELKQFIDTHTEGFVYARRKVKAKVVAPHQGDCVGGS